MGSKKSDKDKDPKLTVHEGERSTFAPINTDRSHLSVVGGQALSALDAEIDAALERHPAGSKKEKSRDDESDLEK